MDRSINRNVPQPPVETAGAALAAQRAKLQALVQTAQSKQHDLIDLNATPIYYYPVDTRVETIEVCPIVSAEDNRYYLLRAKVRCYLMEWDFLGEFSEQTPEHRVWVRCDGDEVAFSHPQNLNDAAQREVELAILGMLTEEHWQVLRAWRAVEAAYQNARTVLREHVRPETLHEWQPRPLDLRDSNFPDSRDEGGDR